MGVGKGGGKGDHGSHWIFTYCTVYILLNLPNFKNSSIFSS